MKKIISNPKICLSRAVRMLIIPGSILFFILVSGCLDTGTIHENAIITPSLPLSYHNVTKIEVVFFHPVPGCSSCDAVGFLANETVHTYFLKEIANGRLAFVDVNLNLPENRIIAERYGSYSESLWFGIYDDDGFHTVENLNVWYKIYNKDDFMGYMKGELDKILFGNTTAYGSPFVP